MLNTKENYRNSVLWYSLQNTRIAFMLLVLVFWKCAVPSDCAVKGVVLRYLACLDCWYFSRLEHGCFSVVNVECSKVEGPASDWSLVQRIPTEYGVSESDLESPLMRKPLTPRNWCAMGGVIIYIMHSCPLVNTGHMARLSFIVTCLFSAVLCIVYKLIYIYIYTLEYWLNL